MYKLIGIDPGSNMGISILELDSNYSPLALTAFTIKANINLNTIPDLETLHTARYFRLKNQRLRLLNLFLINDPIAVACETPYFNSRMPTAFSSLVETLSTIKQSLIDYNEFMELYGIDPSTIKKNVGANGIAKKESIKEAVSKLDIVKLLDKDIERLDEHSIDAIAIVYSLYKHVLTLNKGFDDVG